MALRKVDAVLLMGKNTLIKKGLEYRMTKPDKERDITD